MRTIFISMLFLSVLLNSVMAETLQEEPQEQLVYEVFHKEKRLGTVTLMGPRENAESIPIKEFSTRTELKAKAFFVTVFSLESQSFYRVDTQGLAEFQSQGKLDGEEFTQRAVRKDSTLVLDSHHEDEALTFEFLRSEYDFTSADEPHHLLIENGGIQQFQVLDLDLLQILRRSYSLAGQESLNISGTQVDCHLIDIQDREGRCRRWVSVQYPALVIREEGVDEDGPYRMVLQSFPEVTP